MNADLDPATQINPDPDQENKNFISSCKFFSILAHETLDPDPESGSAIRKNAVSGSVSGSALNPGSRISALRRGSSWGSMASRRQTFISESSGEHRDGIFELLRSPGIDSKESYSASLCSLAGPVREPYSYSVPSPHRLFCNSSTEESRSGFKSLTIFC